MRVLIRDSSWSGKCVYTDKNSRVFLWGKRFLALAHVGINKMKGNKQCEVKKITCHDWLKAI